MTTDAATTKTAERTGAHSPRRSRWRWIRRGLCLGLLLCAAGLYFLPTIAARFLVRHEAAAWLAETLPAHIEIGHASLGWQSPVLLNDVKVSGDDGKELATVSSVTSKQTLWDFFSGSDKPFEFELEGMRAALVVPAPRGAQGRLDVSGAIDWLMKQTFPRPTRPMTVTIVNGRIDFKDPSGQVVTTLAPISAKYQFLRSPATTQTVVLTAPVASRTDSGEIAVEASWTTDPLNRNSEKLTIDAGWDGQPLTPLQPWLKSVLGDRFVVADTVGKLDLQMSKERGNSLLLKARTRWSDSSPNGAPAGSDEQPGQVQLQVQADFSRPDDRLGIPRLFLQTDEAMLEVRGEIADLSRTETVSFEGEIQSPGEMLIQLLPEHLRRDAKFEDVRFAEISVRGPLKPGPDGQQPLGISTVVSWSSAEAYQIKSEWGRVRITIQGTQVLLEPLDVPVSGGHLRQLPSLDLSTDPITVRFEEGDVLDQVELSEQMCRGWLKYVSPPLSDATSAEGRFSLSVQPGAFPINALEQGDLSGRLNIHSARVGPGPLARDILEIAERLSAILSRAPRVVGGRTWITIQDQAVPFRIMKERVHHEDLVFHVGEMRMSTRGSVGLKDDSLDLLLTMEIPGKWLADAGPVLRSLRGETIELLVGGTLDEPKIDASPLAGFGKRIGTKAAGGLIERILESRQNRDR